MDGSADLRYELIVAAANTGLHEQSVRYPDSQKHMLLIITQNKWEQLYSSHFILLCLRKTTSTQRYGCTLMSTKRLQQQFLLLLLVTILNYTFIIQT